MAARDRAGLDRLLRPQSVAVIGASADPSKTAGRPLHFLLRDGFQGEVWPLNPTRDEIAGLKCYPDVVSLPGPPDAAILATGPERTEAYIRDLAAIGAGGAIVIAAGYAEVGGDGKARQDRLRAAAGGMRLLGPNTIGLLNLTDRVTLSASNALDVEERIAGGVAVVSQSGGILGSLLSRAAAKGVGLSHLVATANEADIDVCDVIEHLLDDHDTRAFAIYIEGLRDVGRFHAVATAAAKAGKRLVVYKIGRSEVGARSAASHTGAIAGEDRLYDGLFAQTGVVRVDRYADLIDVAGAMAGEKKLRGRRVAILTTTGGAGALLADVVGAAGFDAPPPGPKTTARLRELLDVEGFVPDRNPVDLTLAGTQPKVLEGALAALTESEDFDAVLAIAGSSAVGRPDLLAVPAIAVAARTSNPLMVYASPAAPEVVGKLNRAGVPAFDSPEGCAEALVALLLKR